METMKQKNTLNAVGKRKTARAHVIVDNKSNDLLINNNSTLVDYFKCERLTGILDSVIKTIGLNSGLKIQLKGGGKSSQAEAIKFALMKIAIKTSEDWKNKFAEMNWKISDNRQVERKKIGLKKARAKYPFRRR